ncbi:ribose 5-phosphate isomerase B [Nitrospinae bacterium AH_259_B05_G02_I21]|nr:ribose 5-phosphate isomerase B [Nitrospinae bacterium AH_259_B05_G02_I21]
MTPTTIAIGSDHAGFELKEHLKRFLEAQGHPLEDCGTVNTQPVDYPDVAWKVAEAVAGGRCQVGILVCGTGLGMSITANKVPGIRAALCHDSYTARLAREHNDANVLAIGGRITGTGLVEEIATIFLTTPFAGERHARRVAKIMEGETQRST